MATFTRPEPLTDQALNCFLRFVGVRVGVAYSRNKRTLRTRLRNLNQKSQFSIFDSFRDNRVHDYDFLKFVGGLWAWNPVETNLRCARRSEICMQDRRTDGHLSSKP